MHPELLNGKQKCTVIEAFGGGAVVVRPGFKKEFKTLEQAKEFVEKVGWEINVDFVKGSPILRKMTRE